MSPKVLIFSADYVPDSGGIAGHVYQLARALDRKGAQVTVIGGHVSPVSAVLKEANDSTTFREWRLRRAGPRGLRALWFARQAKTLLRSLEKETWDVLHYHNPFPDGLIVHNFPARVRVFTNHSDAFLRAHENRRKRAWYHWLVRGVTAIVGPSEEIATKSLEFFDGVGARVEYIPNGVDNCRFTPGPGTAAAAAQLGAHAGQDIILLAVRRHDPKCGLDYLIRAMPAICSYQPRALLCLVGDGDEQGRLKALAHELGCAERIRFVGRVDNQKLPDLYRTAYLSVLPSIFEAVSLAGLEALACGCPVVGTNVGGIPSFVLDGKTGVLVEPKSPENLAAGICRMLRAPEERMSMAARGRAFVESAFSWDSVADRTLHLYESCLGDNARSVNRDCRLTHAN